MHKLHLLSPAALRKEYYGSSAFPFQIEGQPRSDPFLGDVDTTPLNLSAGHQSNNFHAGEAVSAKAKL